MFDFKKKIVTPSLIEFTSKYTFKNVLLLEKLKRIS